MNVYAQFDIFGGHVIVFHAVAALIGAAVVAGTLVSAIRTFVVPRGVPDRLTGSVFTTMRRIFDYRASRADTYIERDRIMAFYAPLTLFMLPLAWLSLTAIGYAALFWAAGVSFGVNAISLSGSSLVTLGFFAPRSFVQTLLALSEASIGLLLATLLIAFLPTMYGAWQRREQMVALLEVRAGSPPTAWDMIIRYSRLANIERLVQEWQPWEVWFIDLEESHTSLAPLTFFRSAQADRSWVTAAGAILDAAALMASTIDRPRDPQAELTLRAGYIALRRIATFFRLPYDPDPTPDSLISISREEYDEVIDQLVAEGVPIKPDRQKAWLDFAGWRVNYDTVLLSLAALTMAPYAPWASDRSPVHSMFSSVQPR